MIVCGVSDNSLRERILREHNINLQKAIELGQASEKTKLHAQQLTEDTEKFTKFTSKSERNREKFECRSQEGNNRTANFVQVDTNVENAQHMVKCATNTNAKITLPGAVIKRWISR